VQQNALEVMMAKLSHDERLDTLEKENRDLKRRLNLIELYLDSERRERSGITLDEIRSAWGRNGRPKTPECGPA
jgi:hypothetical protein